MSTALSSGARRFSREGKYFAFINGQGKFVIYEVDTSALHQIYTPNLHLNVPCTCFTWLEIGQQQPQSAKKKKKRVSVGSGEGVRTCVAFGTSKGGVALYGLASAQIEKSFEGTGHSGPISAICARPEEGLLYTAGTDGKVIVWSLTDCTQKKVHNLGVDKLSFLTVEGSLALSGSKQLKLWDTEKGKLVQSLVGHTSNTVLVEKVADEDGKIYVFTGSVQDRNVSLWALKNEELSQVGLFAMDDAPECISARMVGSKLNLVTVSKTGVAHYFIKDIHKINANKPLKANHTYEVALDTQTAGTKAVDRLPLFTASVEFTSNQDQLLVAYGTELALKFERITIDRDLKQNVIIRELTAAFRRKGEDEKDLKVRTPTVDGAAAEFLNPVSAAKKSLKAVEIPMEARLENLALAADGGADSRSRTSQKNMAHLLIQGLHSKDAAILRTVFSRNEPELIQRTAERIPAQYVSALLGEISTLMQQKTVHVATAVCWLKALIHCHASQLMALGSENLLANFGTCLGIIEYRVQHAQSLSKLSGRLELLVSQIDRTERLAKNPDELVNEHVLVHQEEDDSDVDSVLGKAQGHPGDSSDEDGDDGSLMNDFDSDEEEEDQLAGSFVRLRNGTADAEEEDEEDDEEMDVSD